MLIWTVGRSPLAPQFTEWFAGHDADVWSDHTFAGAEGRAVDVAINVTAAGRLASLGLSYRELIADVCELITAERLRIENYTRSVAARGTTSADSDQPSASFADEYQPLEEIHRQLQALAALHGAEFIASIAESYEGRTIPVIRFGGTRSGSTKTFWIQGGIHAREWISPATVMFITEQLLTSNDPKVRAVVDEIQFVVAPVVNPDGYAYTWTNSRLWRKNRRPDGLCSGVDLNRNWGERWGECGASTNPCSDTYRGPSAMSEPESAGIGNFVVGNIRRNRDIVAAIDFHAYGELILRPYGWALPSEATPETDPETAALASKMQTAIAATHGRRYTSEHAAELYCASGGADDWFFANATKRSVAGGFCIELRDTGRHGFLLPADQIIPTGEENFEAVMVIAESLLR